MKSDEAHETIVDLWIARAGRDSSASALLREFERAFAAVAARAEQTLSEVTVAAVIDRVVHGALERHPVLAGLTVSGLSVQCRGLREQQNEGRPDHGRMMTALRFVLLELLTILGNLTGDILTPALHAVLSKLPAAEPPAPGRSEETKS